MKKVEAFIRPGHVEEAAHVPGAIRELSGMTCTRAEGFGGRHPGSEITPTPEMSHDFCDIARVEVFCADAIAHDRISCS